MKTSDQFPIDLDRVAETVADRGVDAVDPSLVDRVATRALALGASPTIVAVVLDPTEPAVARVRAFGRLAMIVSRPARDRFVLAA